MAENRIDRVGTALQQAGKKALIPLMTAGLGGYALTEELVLKMEAAGADMVILGVPFSDPIAEGAVIQHASERSLQQGTTLAGILKMVTRLRQKTEMPLVLMMYLNTIFCYGTDRFFRTCQEIGIDGVIVPDMPFEEKDEIQADADRYGIHNISLVTPSSAGRIQMIAADATGFLYCVCTNGATEFLAPARQYAAVPCIVGAEISDAETAKVMCQHCDGVVIDNAIVRLTEQYQEDAPKQVFAFVQTIRAALDEV